ncbi:insulinase family protein [Bacillus haynesii]|uniref:insulinase family protein n=1 Tax=Bacillus haynesii TaxID=1925021 RepID=UPI0003ED9AC5|nr:hypothetical protein M769_0125635 [Bacillus haynesii]
MAHVNRNKSRARFYNARGFPPLKRDFLEHMFFKGDKNDALQGTSQSLLTEFGGQVNAFTSKEYTCYYAKVLDEHASYALEVLF